MDNLGLASSMLFFAEDDFITNEKTKIAVTAEEVWSRNFEKIFKIIGYTKWKYNIDDDNYNLTAQNVFFKLFNKYYSDDAMYLAFYRVCLKNETLTMLSRNNRWNKVHVTDPVQICSGLNVAFATEENKNTINVIDNVIADKHCNIEADLTVKQVDEGVKRIFNEQENFVYEQLKEGWTLMEISKMTNKTVNEITTIRKQLRFAVKQLLGLSQGEYERLIN